MKHWRGDRFVTWFGLAVFVFWFPAHVSSASGPGWPQVYNGGFHDFGGGVAIDSQGNVIVVGYRATEAPPTSSTFPDNMYKNEGINAYLWKYDSAGNLLCEREMKGPGTPAWPNQRESQDTFSGVVVDSQDNIIVSGTISGDYYNASYGYWVAMYLNKYNPDCTPLWGQPVIYKYPGDSAWQSATSVTLDAAENIYVTGSVFGGWGSGPQTEWATWKYSPSGALQSGFPIVYNYSPDYRWPDNSYDVKVDSLGNFVVIGYRGEASGNYDWHVRKYDAERNFLWSDTFAGSASLVDVAYRLAIDSQNNPIVVGYTNKGTSSTPDNDWLVIKYAADGVGGQGQRLWTETYESAPGRNEGCYAVDVDEIDNVLVAGIVAEDASTFKSVLVRLDGSTGDLMDSLYLPNSTSAIPYRIAYKEGFVAVTGYVSAPAPTYNDMYATLVDLSPRWRDGETNLGSGWKWTEWFGYYNTMNYPWIYHQEHQWLYPYDDGTGGAFFWYNDMQEFVWTEPATYPYLYRFGGSPAWLWYQKDSANPRWFYNLTAGAWEQLP